MIYKLLQKKNKTYQNVYKLYKEDKYMERFSTMDGIEYDLEP